MIYIAATDALAPAKRRQGAAGVQLRLLELQLVGDVQRSAGARNWCEHGGWSVVLAELLARAELDVAKPVNHDDLGRYAEETWKSGRQVSGRLRSIHVSGQRRAIHFERPLQADPDAQYPAKRARVDGAIDRCIDVECRGCFHLREALREDRLRIRQYGRNRRRRAARSEERRVGKECRSRWSPYH